MANYFTLRLQTDKTTDDFYALWRELVGGRTHPLILSVIAKRDSWELQESRYGVSTDLDVMVKVRSGPCGSWWFAIDTFLKIIAREPGDSLLFANGGDRAIWRYKDGALEIDRQWFEELTDDDDLRIPSSMSYQLATLLPAEEKETAAAGD